MFETLGLEMTPREASVWFGLLLGLGFGALAQLTRFCLRRALVGDVAERAGARGVWAMALLVAVLGTQGVVALGWIDFAGHRFRVEAVPVIGILAGGLLFGIGTVLARGCLSRLTVLGASGNLRALVVLLVAAIAAHATMQGALAPLRSTLAAVTVEIGGLPGPAWTWAAGIVVIALAVVLRSRASAGLLLGAAALGALVPLGWLGTGFVLFDEFDPIPLDGIAFTGPWAETVFWSVAASLTAPSFGTGLIGGVLAGALAAALASRSFRWESFETAGQMGRSLTGGLLMGMGGVLAGGCTVGAGLSGVPTLSLAALLALAAIAAGIYGADAVQARMAQGRRVAGGVVPAE